MSTSVCRCAHGMRAHAQTTYTCMQMGMCVCVRLCVPGCGRMPTCPHACTYACAFSLAYWRIMAHVRERICSCAGPASVPCVHRSVVGMRACWHRRVRLHEHVRRCVCPAACLCASARASGWLCARLRGHGRAHDHYGACVSPRTRPCM
jgi:hypothetical protein